MDILAVAGLAARSAATAGDALALQAAAPPAVAVVDYQLPDATGLQLASRLKDADPDLPVIVLTGNASLETAVAAVALVEDYLTKPVAAEAFLRAVRAARERRRLVVENRQLLFRLQEANATLKARVRQRTRELHADRQRLAEAQRIARIGSWTWDLHRRVLTSSTELRRRSRSDAAVRTATPSSPMSSPKTSPSPSERSLTRWNAGDRSPSRFASNPRVKPSGGWPCGVMSTSTTAAMPWR